MLELESQCFGLSPQYVTPADLEYYLQHISQVESSAGSRLVFDMHQDV